MAPKKFVFFSLSIAVLATALAIYALLRKGKAASPVYMIMYANTPKFATEKNFNEENFWDNYPYWVLLSRRQKIEPGFMLEDLTGSQVSLQNLLRLSHPIFFRYHGNNLNDSLLNMIFETATRLKLKIGILINQNHVNKFERLPLFEKFRGDIFISHSPVPLRIENSGQNYFFSLNQSFETEDILVPRNEVPEVTVKFLEFIKQNN